MKVHEKSGMRVHDKVCVLLLSFLCAVALFAALTAVSYNPREQTVILERFAQKLERAERIHPDTGLFVTKLIAAVQQSQQPNMELRLRQLSAIKRIELALAGDISAVGTIGIAR